MSDYSSTITPDSLSGIIFALEGVSRSVTLLNGPTGCKFYHSAISDNQTIKQFEFDPLNYPAKWFFGQPRVPCTYLDTGDYVYGSKEKLTEALEFLRDHASFELLGIVNSPGAALIGDDIAGLAEQLLPNHEVLALETPGFSSDICIGFETAAIALLDQLLPEQKDADNDGPQSATPHPAPPPSVNILGISLHHKYFAGDIAELKRLLNLCQIRVNCCLCAESDLAEIRDIPAAALNLVVHPEYGLRTAEYLKSRFGTPFISAGPPIGFAATEALMSQVCSQLKVDDAAFIEESERARARAYAHISRVNSLTGLPKGVGFAVEGSYSELYAYLNFLIHYLAMVPAALKPLSQSSDCFQARLETLLDEIDLVELLEQARQDSFEQNSTAAGADVILASGVTIARAKLSGHRFVGIETALPTIGYLDIVPKTHLGVQGALFLTEQVLNALLF